MQNPSYTHNAKLRRSSLITYNMHFINIIGKTGN